MRYSTARMGRIFVIRLEDGEILHETIERFAAEQEIRAAALNRSRRGRYRQPAGGGSGGRRGPFRSTR